MFDPDIVVVGLVAPHQTIIIILIIHAVDSCVAPGPMVAPLEVPVDPMTGRTFKKKYLIMCRTSMLCI